MLSHYNPNHQLKSYLLLNDSSYPLAKVLPTNIQISQKWYNPNFD